MDGPVAVGKYYQIGKYQFERQLNGRWGVSDSCIGVANYLTPIGALIAQRRASKLWRREVASRHS